MYFFSLVHTKKTDLEHNSPICDEYQTQSVSMGFGTAMKKAHQDDFNDTPQHISEFQVSLKKQDNP